MKSMIVLVVLGVLTMFAVTAGHAEEFKVFESKKYGYSMKIPAEFKMDGKEDKTTTWMFQPGSAPAEAAPAEPKEGKKKGLGGLVKGATEGLVGGKTKSSTSGAASAQELEPALTIYVNWVWMPDVSSATMFDTNMKSDMQNIKSPDPDYRDLVVMDKKNGYEIENGSAYWYKEVDKAQGDEIHRWHIKSYGNKSAYTVGLCGTYAQFKKWGPVYEEVIKSWKLIPMEKQ